jgi:hypothetical protein
MFEFGASDNDLFPAFPHGLGANRVTTSTNRELEYSPGTGRRLARTAGVRQLRASAGGGEFGRLSDPGAFKAEHSEAEPQLVFFKATSTKPAQTNALITTRGGHEISLSLVSQGKSDRSEPVDYVLNCERPRSFLIASTHPPFVDGETKNVATENPPTSTAPEKPGRQEQDLLRAERIENPHWEGKQLQVAVGQAIEKEQQMAVPFAVLNSSARTIELLPPQIQLAGTSKDKHRKAIKAEPVPIKDYWITSRRLVPGARADGIVVFERPTFKESRERFLLAFAQAEEVDRPVLAPIAFVAPVSGGAK